MSVPHALLALLSEGPTYGLRLQSEFQARTGEVWPLNVGQVYTTLQRLERDGLVETDDRDGDRSRKHYRITPAGNRELADWLRTPPDLVPPPRDELMIKVLVALQVPGIDVYEILQVHRRRAVEIMQRYTRVKAAAAKDDLAIGPRGRFGALPARSDRPVAGRRGGSPEAAADTCAGRRGRDAASHPTHPMEVST